MSEMYNAICEMWNAYHVSVDGNLAVGACNAVRMFDRVDLNTRVGLFLTYPDDESGNLLLRVRVGLAVTANELA